MSSLRTQIFLGIVVFCLATSLLNISPNRVRAFQSAPAGVAIYDATDQANCWIESNMYESLDFESPATQSSSDACPSGSVIVAEPVTSQDEADGMGAIFIAYDADIESYERQIQLAKEQLAISGGWSFSTEMTQSLACAERGFTRTMYYRAYNPGVTIGTTVYYWQDSFCNSGITQAKAWVDWNANVYWRNMTYSPPYYTEGHGCTNLSPTASWDTYNRNTSLGGTYTDETINNNTWPNCGGSWGTSYTGSMVL